MAHDMESDGGDVEVENDGSPLEHHLSNLLLELGKFQLLLDTKGQPLDAQGMTTRRARAWFKQASDVHPGGRLFVRSAFCADCETSIRQLGDDNDDAGNAGPAPPRSEDAEGEEEGVTDDDAPNDAVNDCLNIFDCDKSFSLPNSENLLRLGFHSSDVADYSKILVMNSEATAGDVYDCSSNSLYIW